MEYVIVGDNFILKFYVFVVVWALEMDYAICWYVSKTFKEHIVNYSGSSSLSGKM